jgi:DNA-binding winged helix-turn-helix (wHTH) protein/Tol biopolymer transport system component
MSVPAESQPLIRFGEFLLDCETAELRRNGDRSSLQGQPLQILVLLLENPGRLVTREELKKKLWPSDTFVDFDQSLNRAVNRLRDALADSAENPRFVETLPRRGYRFIAPVARDQLKGGAYSSKVHQRPSTQEPLACDLEVVTPLPKVVLAAKSWPFRKLFAVIVLVLLAVGGSFLRQRLPRKHSISFENFEITKVTDNGNVNNVAISPDGHYVAYVTFLGDKQELRLRQVASRSDVQVLPPDLGNFVGLTFSPDGNYIYFVRSDRNDLSFRYLYSVPALGGTPRKLITDVDSGIAFSPDGRQITYEHWVPTRNEAELKIANSDGTGERVLAVIHDSSFTGLGGPGPSWSPNGRTIVLSKLLVGKERRWVIYAVSVADATTRELYSSNVGIGRPVWLPSGDTLLFPHYESSLRRNQLWTLAFPDGVVRRLTHDLSDYSEDLSLTNDGATAASTVSTVESQIWAFPSRDPARGRQITTGEPPMFWVKETIDGKILSSGGDGRLWMMNSDGTNRALFGNVAEVGWVSTCGQFVFLTSEESGSTTLKRLNLDGTHPIILARGNLWSPTCSKDDGFVYYANTEQPQKIWRVPIEGGSPVELTSILGDCVMSGITISPDGNLLAYTYSTYTGVPRPSEHMAIIQAHDGKTLRLFDVPGNTWIPGSYWTPGGDSVQYLLVHDQVSNIWEQSLDGRVPRKVTNFSSGQIFDFSWSADRKRLFLTRGNSSSDVILLSGLH